MEFIIVIVAAVLGIVSYALSASAKKKEQENKAQQAKARQVQVKNDSVFQNNSRTTTTQKPSLPAKRSIDFTTHKTIQSSLRDHMHGTTIVTSKETCDKPHDGSYVETFETITANANGNELTTEQLRQAIIIGDAINTPAFKKRYNK